MDNFNDDKISEMLEKYDLTAEEKEFIRCSHTSVIRDMNQSKVISEIMLAKTIEQSVKKTISSNNELQESNDKHNVKISWLTMALVFVGFIQAIAIIIQVIKG